MLLQLLLERLVLRNRRMATGHSGTDLVRRLRVGQPTSHSSYSRISSPTPPYTIPNDRVASQDAGQCLTGRSPSDHVGTDDGVIPGIAASAAAQNRRQTQRAVTITTTSAVVVVVVASVVVVVVVQTVAEHAADLLSRL